MKDTETLDKTKPLAGSVMISSRSVKTPHSLRTPHSFRTPPATGKEIVKGERVQIEPADMRTAEFKIRGTAYLCIHRFSQKAQEQLVATQKAGQTSRKGSARKPKEFDMLYEEARYVSTQGWDGIPASTFRNACIGVCRLVGFKMTIAKMSIFTVADGFDAKDGTPLVRITKGKPEKWITYVRVANRQPDMRIRPRWNPGWEATVRLRYDASQFKLEDVTNLLVRAGMQNGICEGRPSSEDSCGMEYGLFEVLQ